jgi:hypothetical protein
MSKCSAFGSLLVNAPSSARSYLSDVFASYLLKANPAADRGVPVGTKVGCMDQSYKLTIAGISGAILDKLCLSIGASSGVATLGGTIFSLGLVIKCLSDNKCCIADQHEEVNAVRAKAKRALISLGLSPDIDFESKALEVKIKAKIVSLRATPGSAKSIEAEQMKANILEGILDVLLLKEENWEHVIRVLKAKYPDWDKGTVTSETKSLINQVQSIMQGRAPVPQSMDRGAGIIHTAICSNEGLKLTGDNASIERFLRRIRSSSTTEIDLTGISRIEGGCPFANLHTAFSESGRIQIRATPAGIMNLKKLTEKHSDFKKGINHTRLDVSGIESISLS